MAFQGPRPRMKHELLADITSAAAEAPCLRHWSLRSALCRHCCVFTGQWWHTGKLLQWGRCGSVFCGFVPLLLGGFVPTGSRGQAMTWDQAASSGQGRGEPCPFPLAGQWTASPLGSFLAARESKSVKYFFSLSHLGTSLPKLQCAHSLACE